MNKKQLAERLAKQSHRSRGEAADTVDKLVYGIIKDLKSSQNASAKKGNSPVAKPTPRSRESSSLPVLPAKTEKGHS